MRAATGAVLGVVCTLLSCAKGVSSKGSPSGPERDAEAQSMPPARDAASAGDSEASEDAGTGGDPCTMDQTMTCACEAGGEARGTRSCAYSASSPLGGFFTRCMGCPASSGGDAASEQCSDDDKNGFETDVDCGGPDCDRCAPGSTCIEASDCVSGSDCDDLKLCTEPRDDSRTFSNYDHDDYDYAHAVELDCAGTTTFDSTGQGSFTTTSTCSDSADERFEVSCGIPQTEPSGPSVCILRASSFTLGASHTLVLIGDKPVIFAIDGDAVIEGMIDASARGATPGAGGNFTGCQSSQGANGQTDTEIDDGAGGGAGGGFAAAGGKGGTGDDDGPNPEGQGGAASAAASDLRLVPLRGGCKGGDGGDGWNGGVTGVGGAGGGAVQISARGALTVSGTITAGGGGGTAGDDDEDGGGGGGSGGAILLEAGGEVEVTGSLRVHGGSGGGGAGTGNDPGADGSDGASGPALGGAGGDAGGASDGGPGGAGGTATHDSAAGSAGTAGGDGQDQGISGGGGGGGGGSAGVVIAR